MSGIIAALAVLEVGLRPLATADLPPLARPAADSLGSPVVTSRQLEEGIAESHFSSAGARLTGNPTIPGAPLIVILGDSHVVAREVTDVETMGSWVERLARAENYSINVRQYGWRGASPPQYLMVARDVMSHWHPAQVVVVLDGDDLGPDPLNRRFPRMRIGKNDAVQLVRGPRRFRHLLDSSPIHPRDAGQDPLATRCGARAEECASVAQHARSSRMERHRLRR